MRRIGFTLLPKTKTKQHIWHWKCILTSDYLAEKARVPWETPDPYGRLCWLSLVWQSIWKYKEQGLKGLLVISGFNSQSPGPVDVDPWGGPSCLGGVLWSYHSTGEGKERGRSGVPTSAASLRPSHDLPLSPACQCHHRGATKQHAGLWARFRSTLTVFPQLTACRRFQVTLRGRGSTQSTVLFQD